MTLEDLQAREVELVALLLVDTAGVSRMKCVPMAHLAQAVEHGVGFPTGFTGALADDSSAEVPGLEGPVGDLRLVPDLDAAGILAWAPGWAMAPVDQYEQSGTRWPGCRRHYLRRMVERAQALGIGLRAGFELEWVPARADADGVTTIHDGPAYGGATFGAVSGHLRRVYRALSEAGVDVAQLHAEYSPGQLELSLAPTDPLRAADNAVLARHAIRAIAIEDGWRASFSPAGVGGALGNGGHVHISPWRGGVNLLHGGSGPGGMHPEGASFVAGVLHHLAAMTALAAPSPVSALRLQPSSWAGAYACWGVENREAALRLAACVGPQAPETANVEWKTVDAAANQYLVLGSVIAAGIDGVEQGLDLPAGVDADPASLSAEERSAAGVERLPTALAEAAETFADSQLLRDAMGEFLHSAVTAVHRKEATVGEGFLEAQLVERYRWRY